MIPSIDKVLHYINAASKDNCSIQYLNNNYQITAKSEFGVRPSFFHKDECLSCGQCCRNYDTVMFPQDIPEIRRRAESGQESYQSYLDNCDEYSIFVNSVEKKFYSVPPMTAKDNHDIWTTNHTVLNCRWIFIKDSKKLCKIHEYRCITCGFPHMEIYPNRTETVGFLGHKQFGRNHQLKCPVDIWRPMDQETFNDNVYWLNRLKSAADYLGIETYLSDVLDFLQTVDITKPPAETVMFKKNRNRQLFKTVD